MSKNSFNSSGQELIFDSQNAKFEMFRSALISEIELLLPPGIDVSARNFDKNNGFTAHGIVLCASEASISKIPLSVKDTSASSIVTSSSDPDTKPSAILSSCDIDPDCEKELSITCISKSNAPLNNIPADLLFGTSQTMSIGAVFYIDQYFNDLVCGNRSIKSMANEIVDTYDELSPDNAAIFSSIKDFSQIRSLIVFRLINTSLNPDLLKNLPHKSYLDLSIVFYCLLPVSESSNAYCAVTNELLSYWNTDVEELFSLARNNTPKLLPYEFNSIGRMLLQKTDISSDQLTGDHSENINSIRNDPLLNSVYVLSNSQSIFGAAAILYENVLKKCADILRSDYYVIPVCIHEVLIFKESFMSASDTIKYLRSLNMSSTAQSELLSENVYRYNMLRSELELL